MTLIELEESVTCRPWMRWAAVCIGAVAFWFMAWPIFGDDVTRAIKGPPLVHYAVRVVPPEPRPPGSVVRILFDQERRYACPAQIVRWWLDAEGNRLADLPMKTGGYTPPGRRTVAIRLRIPPVAAGQTRIGYRVKIIHEGPGCAPGFVTDPPVAWVPIAPTTIHETDKPRHRP